MKFFGEPNQAVRKYDRKHNRYIFLFRFDKNGEFQTKDEKLIELLKPKFEHFKPNYDKMTFNELRQEADFSTYQMSKKEILEKLKRGE